MSMRKKIIALIIALVIVIAGLYVIPFEVMAGDSKCIASGCNYVRARGSMYCNTHTCRYALYMSFIMRQNGRIVISGEATLVAV